MYRQNNQHINGPPPNRFPPTNPNGNSQCAAGDMGNPFMSPMNRPRFQSSPRYQAQFGSPFPDPYWRPPGGLCPQRSPRFSPRYDYSHASPESYKGGTDSPHFRGNKCRSLSKQCDNGRGVGNMRYPKDLDSFSSPCSSDSTHYGSDDIRLYYSPEMVLDPWEKLRSREHNST